MTQWDTTILFDIITQPPYPSTYSTKCYTVCVNLRRAAVSISLVPFSPRQPKCGISRCQNKLNCTYGFVISRRNGFLNLLLHTGKDRSSSMKLCHVWFN